MGKETGVERSKKGLAGTAHSSGAVQVGKFKIKEMITKSFLQYSLFA